ncbi:hypothetical protein [Tabrizicola oligotrophica]|uniref:Succinate dehydrogenase n=1 Tax=Tabrizicola oligotrophica TaxID=2710650 RepID=A0A6M0QVT3_9RHOB|nr:hypothetical protein [Tabrizicola oligotrophica]NEY90773.1 hypothetical protein [Tabrizicola oligotrophica]
MRAAGPLLMVFALAACDPAQVADKVGRRAADTVVRPVVADYLPGGQAETATRCIVDNASAEDVKALAQDVGVGAGSRTVANVLRIAAEPGPASCLAAAGIAGLGG